MKKVFYEKKGRRYIPISEYDDDFHNSVPYGSHITVSKKGCSMRRYNIEPAFGPLIAAGIIAEDEMVKALIKASEARPSPAPLTDKQQKAWKNLKEAFEDDLFYIQYPSGYDIIRAGIQALIKESEKTLEHPSVKKAWERFLLICELVKDEKN